MDREDSVVASRDQDARPQSGTTVWHTPGPWLAATAASTVVGLPVVATASGRSIASVTFFRLGADFSSHDHESLANARLISAAPDLLAALKALDEDILGRAESNASGNPEWEYVSKRINAARAAIAKASQSAGEPREDAQRRATPDLPLGDA